MVAKKIRHQKGRATDDRPLLIAMTAKSMHLTRGEAEVLSVLCSQQDGFAPSAKFLMAKTAMSHGGVYKARTALNRMGVIGETDTHIIIDWHRIRLLSTLDPKMTSRSAYVAPVVPSASRDRFSGDWTTKIPEGYGSNIDFLVHAPECTIIEFFRSLSESEYADVCQYIENTLAR